MEMIAADMPAVDFERMFQGMVDDGMLQYVLPSTDGEMWVLGLYGGGLLKLDRTQAAAFLVGNQETLQYLMRNLSTTGLMQILEPEK